MLDDSHVGLSSVRANICQNIVHAGSQDDILTFRRGEELANSFSVSNTASVSLNGPAGQPAFLKNAPNPEVYLQVIQFIHGTDGQQHI